MMMFVRARPTFSSQEFSREHFLSFPSRMSNVQWRKLYSVGVNYEPPGSVCGRVITGLSWSSVFVRGQHTRATLLSSVSGVLRSLKNLG